MGSIAGASCEEGTSGVLAATGTSPPGRFHETSTNASLESEIAELLRRKALNRSVMTRYSEVKEAEAEVAVSAFAKGRLPQVEWVRASLRLKRGSVIVVLVSLY